MAGARARGSVLAADDDSAGQLVAQLIQADGYEPVRVGGLDKSIRIEAFGEIHELGALAVS